LLEFMICYKTLTPTDRRQRSCPLCVEFVTVAKLNTGASFLDILILTRPFDRPLRQLSWTRVYRWFQWLCRTLCVCIHEWISGAWTYNRTVQLYSYTNILSRRLCRKRQFQRKRQSLKENDSSKENDSLKENDSF